MSWAVILGVSSGSGAAAAKALARDAGLDIFGVHRGNHVDGAREVREAVQDAGRRYAEALGDASKPRLIDEIAASLAAEHGPGSVHFLLHSIASASVGTLVAGAGPHLTPRQIQRTFDKMAHSFPWWVQALDRHDLLGPGARVLGLTNPVPCSLIRGTAAITASKAALDQYMRHLAFELGPRGIKVNLLNFGMVESPATQATFTEDYDQVRAVVRRVTPAGRLVSIQEVARVIALLAGPDLAWFNGATIDLTGGEMLAHYDALVHPDPVKQD